jgi:resuscitation-promoting factor RpfB
MSCLIPLWEGESGWRWNAENASSGAYGIPQSLPGDKMASVASDWRTNPVTQIKWGLEYIKGSYGSPCGAWDFKQGHGWY